MAQPAHFLSSMEKTTFVHLTKKSKYLKLVFFVISSNLVVTSEWSVTICNIIDRFMTSEGTDTLIVAFTSKTGNLLRVTHTDNFYLDFYVREMIYLGFISA